MLVLLPLNCVALHMRLKAQLKHKTKFELLTTSGSFSIEQYEERINVHFKAS